MKKQGGLILDFLKKIPSWFKIAPSTDVRGMLMDIRTNTSIKDARRLLYLIFGTFIVCMGLDLNSELIITTGGLVTPIVYPIMGLALSIYTRDSSLRIQALENLILLLTIIILVSSIYFALTPFGEFNSQIRTWSQNNFLNIFIAVAAGVLVFLSISNPDKMLIDINFTNILIAPTINVIGYGIAKLNLLIILNSFYYLMLHIFFICFALYYGFKYTRIPKEDANRNEIRISDREERNIRLYTRILFVIIILPSLFFVNSSLRQRNINTTLKSLEVTLNKAKEEKVIKINKSSQLSKAKEKVIEVFLVDDKAFSDSLIKAQTKELEKINYKLIVHRLHTSKDLEKQERNLIRKAKDIEDILVKQQNTLQDIRKKLSKEVPSDLK